MATMTLRLAPEIAQRIKPRLDPQPPAKAVAPVKSKTPEKKAPKQPRPMQADLAAKRAAIAAHDAAERLAATKRRQAMRTANAKLLAERFACFDLYAPKPLALGTSKALNAMNLMPARQLGYLMLWWSKRPHYLRALIAGGPRYDLDGNEAGSVSERDQADAAARLAEYEAKQQAAAAAAPRKPRKPRKQRRDRAPANAEQPPNEQAANTEQSPNVEQPASDPPPSIH